jgi:hypothetical protein
MRGVRTIDEEFFRAEKRVSDSIAAVEEEIGSSCEGLLRRQDYQTLRLSLQRDHLVASREFWQVARLSVCRLALEMNEAL